MFTIKTKFFLIKNCFLLVTFASHLNPKA